VGEAALDQTEAELLEEEAKSLNAAENTAATAGRPWLKPRLFGPWVPQNGWFIYIWVWINIY
jgi:hypothetical protein